jgi:hypothetical protein
MQLTEMSQLKKRSPLTLTELTEEIADRFCRRGAWKRLAIDRVCIYTQIDI